MSFKVPPSPNLSVVPCRVWRWEAGISNVSVSLAKFLAELWFWNNGKTRAELCWLSLIPSWLNKMLEDSLRCSSSFFAAGCYSLFYSGLLEFSRNPKLNCVQQISALRSVLILGCDWTRLIVSSCWRRAGAGRGEVLGVLQELVDVKGVKRLCPPWQRLLGAGIPRTAPCAWVFWEADTPGVGLRSGFGLLDKH